MGSLVKELQALQLHKWYTRVIGIFFLLVALTLITDYYVYGHRPETWHKLFHVIVGAMVVRYGWYTSTFWIPFCLVNGLFFTFVAMFGWVFPDFGGLDAFNRVDTILHSIVGISGLGIGLLYTQLKELKKQR